MTATDNVPLGTIDGADLEEAESLLPVIDPSTEATLAMVPVTSAASVDRAVLAAERAFDAWAELTPVARDEHLNALADALAAQRAWFAETEARNVGKPLEAAAAEVDACVAELRYFGGAARQIEGRGAAEYVADRTSFTRRDPVGVVAQITPWNYPLQMAIWKIGPALAAGNTVVLKPSELTPLTTLRLGELARDILPAGVLNVVPGDGAVTGDALVRHPRVRMICLTGDVATGRKVAANAAANIKRVHLELGGKAPVIVFDDADTEQLAETLRVASYYNSGQDCTAACRILVSDRHYDNVLSALVPQVQSLRVGGPFETLEGGEAEMGPVISERQRDRVLGFLDRAQSEGVDVLTGGTPARDRGWFVAPTVIGGVTQEQEIVRREVFGPVITVQRFADEAQALAWANDVEYGLSASVWSRDIGRCLRMARKLQFGCVWLNDHLTIADEMPHGGFKQSGYGKDLSSYSIDDYTVVKHVMARID
jgi:1-pyrroline dehydrogenase